MVGEQGAGRKRPKTADQAGCLRQSPQGIPPAGGSSIRVQSWYTSYLTE